MSGAIHSLWFKPTGPAFDVLADVVAGFARELGASPFAPHVTLLGNLKRSEPEILRRSEALAQELHRFEIELTEPAYWPHPLAQLCAATPSANKVIGA